MNDEGREVGHCGFLLLVAVHQETSRILASGIHHPPVSAPRRSATSTPQVRPGLVFQSIDVHLKKIVGQIQLRGISLTERPYDEGARARRHVDLL